jgi:hypothetical protein
LNVGIFDEFVNLLATDPVAAAQKFPGLAGGLLALILAPAALYILVSRSASKVNTHSLITLQTQYLIVNIRLTIIEYSHINYMYRTLIMPRERRQMPSPKMTKKRKMKQLRLMMKRKTSPVNARLTRKNNCSRMSWD